MDHTLELFAVFITKLCLNVFPLRQPSFALASVSVSSMDCHKGRLENYVLISLFVFAIVIIFVWPSSNPLTVISNGFQSFRSNSTDEYKDELDTVLGKAATVNKTVIIAVINKAYSDQGVDDDTTMLEVFLNGLWLGEDTAVLLDHLILVAVDQTAYNRCRFERLNCFKLETEGVDFGGEQLFMSTDFIEMMWARTSFLLHVLRRGYSFIFTDADVMWLRNPFPKLSKNESEDLQISVDGFNGDPWSAKNQINTGFYFVRSNNKTISLFERWYSMKDNSPAMKEQDVLYDLITHKGIISQLGLRVRFLDTVYFSGFCQNSKDFRQVSTVHANCCRTIAAKISDLRLVLRDWKIFQMSKNSTEDFRWSYHRSCKNSWKVKKNMNSVNVKSNSTEHP